MPPHERGPTDGAQPLRIGSLLFDGLDQIDLTGPFEVLSRLSNSDYRPYAKSLEPVRDVGGLVIPLATDLKLTNIIGGSPLIHAGTVVGAIGIADGTPDQDAQIAAATAAALPNL